MPSKYIPASQVLKDVLNQAYAALTRGDKGEARRLAQQAASIEPNSEEPWLILGAASQPRASIAYLKKALEINPASERARGGLEWAARRLNEKEQSAGQMRETTASQQKPPSNSNQNLQGNKAGGHPRSRTAAALRIFIPIMLLSTALLLVAAWTFRPGMDRRGANLSANAIPSQTGSLVSGQQADGAKLKVEPLPSETLSAASPSPTAFQPVPATATPTVQSLSGLLEGEFFAAQLPAGGDKLITVSIQDQRLQATQGGTLIATFVVSTGRGNNTRTGSFHILDKIPNAFSYIWNFWMPDWMGIYYAGTLENGFHALPILPNGNTIWGDALGTPISYGCVVMGVPEAQALFNWADVGTSVQINP